MSEPLRTLLVGFGRQAERAHLPAILGEPRLRLVGILDPAPARRELVRTLRDVGTIPEDCRIFAGPMGPAAEVCKARVVVLASPPGGRDKAIQQALAAGARAVLVEKPLASTPGELEALPPTPEGGLLFPCNTWLREGSIAFVTAELRNGRIGNPTSFSADICRIQPAQGQGGNPNWRASAPGGIWNDLGYHVFTVLQEWMGNTAVQWKIRHGYAGPSGGRIHLETPTGPAYVYLSWDSPFKSTYLSLTGTRGRRVVENGAVEDERGDTLYSVPGEGSDGIHLEAYRRLYRDFLEALDRGNDLGEWSVSLGTQEFVFRVAGVV